jgi:hypothetical protein
MGIECASSVQIRTVSIGTLIAPDIPKVDVKHPLSKPSLRCNFGNILSRGSRRGFRILIHFMQRSAGISDWLLMTLEFFVPELIVGFNIARGSTKCFSRPPVVDNDWALHF